MKFTLPKIKLQMKGSVRQRLLAGFMGVAGTVALAGGVSVVAVLLVASASNQIVNVHNPRMEAASQAQVELLLVSDAFTEALIQTSVNDARALVDEAAVHDAEARRMLTALLNGDEELRVRAADAEDRAIYEEALADYEAFYEAGQGMLKAHTRNLQGAAGVGQQISVLGLMETFDASRSELLAAMDQVQTSVRDDVHAADAGARAFQTGTVVLMLILIAMAAGAALVIGLKISTTILAPLAKAVELAEAVALGDLTAEAKHDSSDELGVLLNSLNGMRGDLAGMIGVVRDSADNLASAADEISATAHELSAGAELQSAATEETSASIEQMAASIDQVAVNAEQLGAAAEETSATIGQMAASIEQIAGNVEHLSRAVTTSAAAIEEMIATTQSVADNAASVDDIAEEANRVAADGASAVDEMADAMRAIAAAIENSSEVIKSLGKRSKEIGEITEAIDDIAEQTNLLALNAAIEAARAGEHGRGFAVVAEAVRDLAERAAASTKEITDLINTIQEDTERAVDATIDGARRAMESQSVSEEATAALGRVISTFGQVSESMKEIRKATAEQATSGQQVLASVNEMTVLHRQVDTAVKEQANGSQQIVASVERMAQLVGQVVTATGEQKRGGEHMVVAMENIAQGTSRNLNGIKGLAESAEVLTDQSAHLRSVVEGFKLEE